MRLSALAGILVSAITFLALTQDAQASPLLTDLVKSDANETVVELLVEKAEIAQQEKQATEPIQAQTQEAAEEGPLTHVVVAGESLQSIAAQYETTWKRIYDKNQAIADPDIVEVRQELVLPTDDEELVSRELPVPAPVSVVPVTAQPVSAQPQPAAYAVTDDNRYVAGYCTWHVKNLRPDLPNNLGNAITWVSRAASQGIPTGSTPRVGAVGQRGNHVVYIKSVNPDGTVTTSEMNYKGLWIVSERTLPASYFSYIY